MRKYLNALMRKCVSALMRNCAKKEHAINNMLLTMDNIYHYFKSISDNVFVSKSNLNIGSFSLG